MADGPPMRIEGHALILIDEEGAITMRLRCLNEEAEGRRRLRIVAHGHAIDLAFCNGKRRSWLGKHFIRLRNGHCRPGGCGISGHDVTP